MRRPGREALRETSQKCDQLTERALDAVFETTYRLLVEHPLPEDAKPNAKNLACLVFTYAVCSPLAISAWALRQASVLASLPKDE